MRTYGSIREEAKRELRAARRECLSRVSSLANYNLLRYLSAYSLQQNCALVPTALSYSKFLVLDHFGTLKLLSGLVITIEGETNNTPEAMP